jgi:tryptophan synthase alpha chain
VSIARLTDRFARLAAENRAAFVAYVMAGDPDPQTAETILTGLPAAGADIIELGMPFSDPMADGPPIQKAAIRALAHGVSIEEVFAIVRRFRQTDQATPIVLMGYMNPLMAMGLEAFAAGAGAAGVDGLIIVDVPPEEADELTIAAEAHDVALIRLITPTTDEARLALVAKGTRGFVYYVSVTGVTGGKAADAVAIAPAVERARRVTGLPVAVGFGIRTPERAAEVARIADAAVVGSALVDKIADALSQSRDPAANVLALARELAESVHLARGG